MQKSLVILLAALILVAACPLIAAGEIYADTEAIALNEPDEHVIGTPWSERLVKTPELIVPDTLAEWKAQRSAIRREVVSVLGDLPELPTQTVAQVYDRGETPLYTFERLYLDNGYGDNVPGTIYIPKELNGPAPAILYLHYHGDEFETGQNEVLFSWPLADEGQPLVDEFIKRGYVVMAIDAYAFTSRSGMGPGYVPETDEKETGLAEEASLYKYFTVQGLSYMGMILRDDILALNYLSGREEVDAERIGATGMSMGGTRANWLAALDERIRATVSVACLTRMQDFIRTGNIKWHAFFNWVPGMLEHFDTETVVSLIAPRAYMQLMGDVDIGSPVEGVRYIQGKMEEVYALYGASDNLEFHYYENLDHDYLPEEFELMLDYFDDHLKNAQGPAANADALTAEELDALIADSPDDTSLYALVEESGGLRAYFYGAPKTMEGAFMQGGVLMVPLAQACEAVYATCEPLEDGRFTVSLGDASFVLTVESNLAVGQNLSLRMSRAVQTDGTDVFVPAGFFADALDLTVYCDVDAGMNGVLAIY